jgi:hypothetical protein
VIYFVRQQDNPSLVKVGKTQDLPRRMHHLAAASAIVLFATCEGDSLEERYFLKKFAHLRSEGEWFNSDEAMLQFISQNADSCHVEYGKSETRWTLRKPDNRKHQDAIVIAILIKRMVDAYPRGFTLSRILEEIYLSLAKIGDGWTRRRVRSLYDQTAHRIDAYELIDFLKISDLPEDEWIRVLRGEYHDSVAEAAE